MSRKNEDIQEIDKIIGGEIYSLRLAQGKSREQLSSAIGVTHQQLQKYEKGTNRISVGRLVLIAKALGKNVSYFFAALSKDAQEETLTQHQRMCLEVSRNFMKIRDAEHQNAINTMVRSLVTKDNKGV